jgi:hypothetical protein
MPISQDVRSTLADSDIWKTVWQGSSSNTVLDVAVGGYLVIICGVNELAKDCK